MPWLAVYVADISVLSSFVSLHLYLKVHPGKLEAVKAGSCVVHLETAAASADRIYAPLERRDASDFVFIVFQQDFPNPLC